MAGAREPNPVLQIINLRDLKLTEDQVTRLVVRHAQRAEHGAGECRDEGRGKRRRQSGHGCPQRLRPALEKVQANQQAALRKAQVPSARPGGAAAEDRTAEQADWGEEDAG
jgi:hypothetical protein